uniref:protein-ribulosamine 3-kinase n=1 Tax=Nomascus leucogenys TaxID=61853 RepID=M3ZAH7_NOMLE
MEQLLRAELRTATLRAFGSPGAYSISEGRAYDTDAGPVFVKVNRKTQRGGEGAEPQYVNKFGFHKVTCCGFIPQVNEWQDDWPTFFVRHRLQAQLDLIEKDYADREARELWSRLQVKIPDLFCGLEIVPALLHGDLWSGNVAEDDVGPIIYDPASFYGHSE